MASRSLQQPNAHTSATQRRRCGGPRGSGGPGRASRQRAELSSRHGPRAGGQAVPLGPTRLEVAAWPAGPGRASRQRAEQSSRRGPRAGGLAVPLGPARLEVAAWPAGPGRASRRRAERSSRRGRRAGGQDTRQPEIRRGEATQPTWWGEATQPIRRGHKRPQPFRTPRSTRDPGRPGDRRGGQVR